MRSDVVRTAAVACTGLLGTATGRDWTVRAGAPDMTVAEVVAHIAEVLTAHVLRRLVPWAPHEGRSWPTLRWANGRTSRGARPRLETWRWHCAPLAEWDGTGP
ncbi:hypothetical protein ACL02T_21030 [Pseudonocardia sp. RS010]|uniref:hypothetical protein n=1 Tax=Pseudonocardia sp. RS010 TaxID=3385979 RepID=UPI0039A195F2